MQILTIEALIVLFLIILTIAVILNADLFACAIIFCAFSFCAVLTYLFFGSPDVAFTEAVIGTMSTVFYAIALRKVDRFTKNKATAQYDDNGNPINAEEEHTFQFGKKFTTFLIVAILAGMFCFGATYLPAIGDANSAPNTHVSDYYIEYSKEDTASNNIVSGTLADYRGFDTMFETSVMFVSGLVVTLVLLPILNKKDRTDIKPGEPSEIGEEDL